MNKSIIYVIIAALLGLSRVWLNTPWWLITAPIWSPISTVIIETIIHRVKRNIKDGQSYN